jgi:mono/diheme cytochrome c family protein
MNRILFLYFVFAGLAAAQHSAPASEGDAAKGKVLFTRIGCYECHGYSGQGGRAGARIVPMPFRAQDMIRYVRRPAGEMPAYTEKSASDQELKDIYAYLKSFPPPKTVKEIPLLDKIEERK